LDFWWGIALSYLKESGVERLRNVADTVLTVCDGAAEAMYKIVRGVLQYAPIGVLALIAVVFGTQGAKAASSLGTVTLAVYLALIVHVFLIYGGFLSAFRFNIFKFLSRAKEASVTAFVTRSSSGTLPVTMRMILGIDAILDMGRTSVNVAGDLAGTTIVAKSENEINLGKWKS